MFTLIDFILVLLVLFFLHEILHFAIAKLLGFPAIALFFAFPLGIAMLVEDEGKTRGEEIAIKVLPGLITIALAVPFLFISMPFGLSLIIALAVASLRDFDFALKAVKAQDLQQYFVQSEADDLRKIATLKKKGLAKAIVLNQQLWANHLKRANLQDFAPR